MSKADDEVEVSYGPAQIQTPQDAATAYLREEIDEDKLREICGKFGVLPGQLLTYAGGERPDAAFERTLPDDLFLPVPPVKDDLEARQKAADEKAKEREEAEKAATKDAPLRVSTVPDSGVRPSETKTPDTKK